MTSGHPCPRPYKYCVELLRNTVNWPEIRPVVLRSSTCFIENINIFVTLCQEKNVFNTPSFYRSHSAYSLPSENAASFRKTNSQCGPVYWEIPQRYVV